MTYDIRIGDAVPNPDDTESARHPYMVPIEEDEGAPTFAYDLSGQTNRRDLAMLGWEAFARETGLHDLFFHSEHGLCRSPACRTVPLTRAHLDHVARARERWVAGHLSGTAGWDYTERLSVPPGVADDGVRGRDGHLALLLWLEWWMARALAQSRRQSISIG
jgi:hypothetical protein